MAASTRARTLGLRRRFARHVTQGQSPASNVLRMLAGNASAQLLTLAAYPILTRLYTPGQIGVLSALISVGSAIKGTDFTEHTLWAMGRENSPATERANPVAAGHNNPLSLHGGRSHAKFRRAPVR